MIKHINVCLFNQAQVVIEDGFECWKQDHFKMTREIENIRFLREKINEWHENEKKYSDEIADEQFKQLYKLALVENNITTHKLNRIDKEYKLLHCNNKQMRE